MALVVLIPDSIVLEVELPNICNFNNHSDVTVPVNSGTYILHLPGILEVWIVA